MQKKWYLFLVVSGLLLLPSLFVQAANFSQTLTFQGKLKETGTSANGTYNMKFELCSTSNCSSVIWTEYHDEPNAGRVTITNGIFNTILGTDTTLVGVDLNQELYLRISVDGTGDSPAYATPVGIISLGMVLAAREADYLDGLDSIQFLRSDATNTSSASSTDTLLILDQDGSGDILNVVGGSTEYFTITSSGRVGVNQATPISPLHVYENTGSPGVFENAGIVIEQDGGGDALLRYYLTGGQNWITGIDNSHDMYRIATGISAGTDYLDNSSVFGITTAGFVGIGDDFYNPTARLHIEAGTNNYALRLNRGGGVFTNQYAIELRTSTGASHGTLIFHNENNTARDILVLASSFGTTTTFKSTGRVGIGTTSPNTLLEVAGDISVGGSNNELRFYEGSNYVGFEAPALSANRIWVLPSADGGANQVLATNGSGVLSWIDGSAASGTVTTFLGLNDTPGSYTASAIPFTNLAGNQLSFSSGFLFSSASSTLTVGSASLHSIGASNTAFGEDAGLGIDTGFRNVLLGSGAGSNLSGGAQNIFVGYQAGYNTAGTSVLGSQNTFIGDQAGYTNTTGASNVFLGFQAGYSETGSNKLYITNSSSTTPLVYGEFDNNIFRINGQTQTTGGITIGVTSTDNLIDDASNGSGSATLYVGNETIDTTVSDQRLKTNITAPADSALAFLNQFEIKAFEWLPENPRHDYGPIPFGLIAQEVKTIAPQYVRETDNPDDYISVRFADLVPALIGAVQELSERMGDYVVGIYEGLIQFGQGIWAPKVATTELCVGGVCVTEDKFREVFGNEESEVLGVTTVPDTLIDELPETTPSSTEEFASTTDNGLEQSEEILENIQDIEVAEEVSTSTESN